VETKESQDISDEEIVKLALHNTAFFAVLVRRYEDKLSRYIRRLGVSSKEDREDVLQNVFIKIYKNLNSFDKTLSFSSWAYRITHNEAVNFFRTKSRRPSTVDIEEMDDFLASLKSDDDITRDTNNSLNNDAILKILDSFDEKYRTVLVLRYLEDREYGEISDILKIPVSSVGVLLHRAKEKLRKEIEGITF
jgi:RNA polymerase sigma-70 factor (ECF subfamily)